MAIALRRASAADAGLIHELAQRIWWAHYPDIISRAQIAYMLEQMYRPEVLEAQIAAAQQCFYLVEQDGAARGFLAISRSGPPGQYFLHKFYLDNEQRGKGLGAEAFRRLLECYPDWTEIRLNVNRRNYKSVNFYFKIGFVIAHCMDTPFGDGYVMDDFQMLLRNRQQVAQGFH
jgi:GNAT superfamily N-acetyltransferase